VLICDSREPQVLLDRLSEAGVPVKKAFLITGDYLITDVCGHIIGIERKDMQDFLSSFADRRLSNQLYRLRRTYYPILLVEGFYTLDEHAHICIRRRPTGWHHAAIQMALFALQSEGIRLIWTTGHPGTVDTLRALHQRAEKRCLLGTQEWGLSDEEVALDLASPLESSRVVTPRPIKRLYVEPSEGPPEPLPIAVKRGQR
jgi:ERCC4-type nuclease